MTKVFFRFFYDPDKCAAEYYVRNSCPAVSQGDYSPAALINCIYSKKEYSVFWKPGIHHSRYPAIAGCTGSVM